MSRMSHIVALAAVFALTSVSVIAAAQRWSNRVSDQQVRDLLGHIDTRTKSFSASVDRAADRREINGSRAEAAIKRSGKDFKQTTDRLRDRMSDRGATNTDLEDVLRQASVIDHFMTANPLDASAQRDWQNLRRDLDELAHMYGVTWYWSSSQYLRSRVDDQQVGQTAGADVKERRSVSPQP
jgi:hypothetical protein